MFDLDKITRANIRGLTPYSNAREEFSDSDGIFLDANENPYGTLNRYPDPYQRELKQAISTSNGLLPQNIFVANGSDEIIDLMFRIFCNPTSDKALTFSPTYGMYDVAANIHDVELIKVELNSVFDIDFKSVEDFISDPNLKLILICSPNNPTGNCLDFDSIQRILSSFNGIVMIDEAYIDFSDSTSFTNLIDKYPNLVVSQTMSKAWGLAAARIGLAFTTTDIVKLLNKVKPPYNVSRLNQEAAIQSIANKEEFLKNKQRILKEKKLLYSSLNQLGVIKKIYPSAANFFLVETENVTQVYEALVQNKINFIWKGESKINIISNDKRITL